MQETVLYYTPSPTRQSRILKGILVRMGIRIRNVTPEQTSLTVGALVGLPGFESEANSNDLTGSKSDDRSNDLTNSKSEADSNDLAGSKSENPADSCSAEPRTKASAIPEEVLVLHQFSEQRLDALLYALRKEKIRIALKAVVTEQNCSWTFTQLYEELKEEHAKMQQI